MVDNAEWLTRLNYIDFLRDVGRHFSVNRMLSMDSVKLRLERDQELSFLEFNYMCLQAYDFVELHRRYGCRAADGRLGPVGQHRHRLDLGRRMGTPQLYALTCPLITTASGRQDGQDGRGRGLAQGRHAVALRLLAVLAQHRGCRRRPLPAAVHAAAARRDRPAGALGGAEINEAKKVLATEATALIHGREAAEAAAETARKTFEQGSARRGPADRHVPRPSSRPASACCRPSSGPAWWPRPAKRAARSRAAASR